MTQHRTLTLAAAALLALAVPSPSQAQAKGLKIGDKAPTAMAHTLDGAPVDLAQYVGKGPMLIEFWATWCPLCKQLEPQFKASQQKYGRTVQFVSVGVPTNQTRDRQLAYITEHALGGTFVFDSAGNAMKAYKVPHTSHVLVVDRSGTIVYTGVGTAQVLDSAIARAMAKSGMN